MDSKETQGTAKQLERPIKCKLRGSKDLADDVFTKSQRGYKRAT